MYTFIILCTGTALLFAKYTQRKTTAGIIYPEKGSFSIYSSRSGVIHNLSIVEGAHVNKGDVLYNIDSSDTSREFDNSEKIYSQLLKERIKSATNENKNEIDTYKKQSLLIDKEIKNEESSIERAQKDIITIDNSISVNNLAYKKLIDAYNNKVITIIDKNNAESQLLEKLLQRSSVEREIDEKRKRMRDLKIQLDDIQSKLSSAENNYKENKIDDLIQYYNNAEKYDYIQKSPLQGVISSVTKKNGAQIQNGEYIMSIIPENSRYQAVMFISPEIIGRLKLNSDITLHIDSYPYQRFGVVYGKIKSISDTPLSVESIYNNYNTKVEHPSYIVVASIERNDQSLKLIPNMTFSADIPLETRSLFKWIYSSLFKTETGITFK
ncbi:HlyD family secretion protein [Klebsiella pneumoniae]|uniref:HlyD family secretion protein n=1 Tax=Klebsiella pneumoniae TaxID=573 RepID=UPI000D01E486|nr:HlyD family efflux transporter periplasmic adaptor subunit [Klebsiella pneumoniae]MBR9935467.1 HlyD family efflux transporter periplasmic adaptor subunit [Klebsiella pneumoniae]MDP0958677.1 HlyD family efflux transporter periplasmic adaptor subunit [Klebsiella pneumoniae]MDP0964360.1 HlyD family efflux transporter periplasmic adaptor subunit [Klebsiella pneumoniae]MDP1044532.1 HlyD family efflux transporter periplasmic adaptor subunit [Klebsiella pneumoniae]MDP1314650.1 HlyD family efflux t